MHILRNEKHVYIVNHQIHGTARKFPDKAKPPKLKLATTYLLEPSSATRCWLVRWLVSMIKNSSSNNNSSNNNNNHNHNHNHIIIIIINNMNHNHNHNYNHSESRLPKLGGLPAPSNKHGKLSSCWSVILNPSTSTPCCLPNGPPPARRLYTTASSRRLKVKNLQQSIFVLCTMGVFPRIFDQND